jgi:hypothetical protein
MRVQLAKLLALGTGLIIVALAALFALVQAR